MESNRAEVLVLSMRYISFGGYSLKHYNLGSCMAITSPFPFWGTNIRDSNAIDEEARSSVSEAYSRSPLFLQMHHFHPKSRLALNLDQLLMLPLVSARGTNLGARTDSHSTSVKPCFCEGTFCTPLSKRTLQTRKLFPS